MPHTSIRNAWLGGGAVAAALAGLLAGSPAQAVEGSDAAASYGFTAKIVIGDSDRGCTGTLVAPQWVLTSASCFADATGSVPAGKPPTTTTVTVGRTDLTTTTVGATRTAIQLVPHPDRDLVLVKLNAGVAGVKPVALATTPVAAGDTVQAAGFGRTKTAWAPDNLHTGSFTAAADGTADVDLTATGGSVICAGDAGGPVLRTVGAVQQLVAITSRSWQGGCFGMPATETRTGAIATRTDDVRAWITSTSASIPGDMNGDQKPDLVAVNSAGKLLLYPGTGTGALGSPTVIGSGGWSGTSVTHRGDWTGDGMEDIVARVGSELRVYPNLGNGTLANPIVIASGLPTTAQVVGVGDVNQDGQPDLVISYNDKLYLYTGVSGINPSVHAPVVIGTGGWGVMTMTAPGDADKDGRVDLLARDTRDGTLYLYRGQAGGLFGGRTTYGTKYTVANRPLIAGAADANQDGVSDMWASAGDGTLKFYKGASSTNGPVDGPSTEVGNGGWDGIKSLS
ncbi:FG-GAP-like repeat-containing protein [Streptomyces sp. CA-111067]|uniref:FG-GAP-like repeat-containing protein n=1 Tax=Streptomyces sp. CA-111067 TaxID=3240046 RepID=UPI003D9661B6